MSDVVRVMIVDDTSFMRRSLCKLLAGEAGIEVVGEAVNGRDAVARFQELRPDVICLDIDMPEMDGLTAMKHIMSIRPTPIIIVSSMTDRNHIPFEALRLGIVDFLPKPSQLSGDMDKQVKRLVLAIRSSPQIRKESIRRTQLNQRKVSQPSGADCRHLIVISGSEGTTSALIGLLEQLACSAGDGIAVICQTTLRHEIVQSFIGSVHKLLGWVACEVSGNSALHAGGFYFVPEGCEVRFSRTEVSASSTNEAVQSDTIFAAASEAFHGDCSLVMMSGEQPASLAGLTQAEQRGGRCFVQDGETALFRDWAPGANGTGELFDVGRICERVEQGLGVSTDRKGTGKCSPV